MFLLGSGAGIVSFIQVCLWRGLTENTGGLCAHKRGGKELVLRRWRLIFKALDKHFKTMYSYFRPPSAPAYTLSVTMGM